MDKVCRIRSEYSGVAFINLSTTQAFGFCSYTFVIWKMRL